MKRPKSDMADWHITLRGARRLLLFHEQEDYGAFYGMLGYACKQSGMSHIASCLLSNHFHLSLTGSSGQLSLCMWQLDRQYSGYHNKKYGLSGHAFEQRYYRAPIPSAFILKRVVRYIHLNPVRAGIVASPDQYRWSSFNRLTKSSPESLGAEEARFLYAFHPDLAQARAEYGSFVAKDLHRPVAHSPSRSAAWEIWEEQFRWFMEFARESRLLLLPLQPEAVAAWWSVKSGIPPRVIGKVLGHPDGRHISKLCYRLSRRLDEDQELKSRILSLGAL